MTDLNELQRLAREAMAKAEAEIEENGGVQAYAERPEWDLSREYRGVVSDVKVQAEEGKTPRVTIVVDAKEPAEYGTSRAWLDFWLSPKAMPYSMKDLTPVLMKAGVPYDSLDITNEELLKEQLIDQSVVFSLQAGLNPEYPQRRFLNPDHGQTLKGTGHFKKNVSADGQGSGGVTPLGAAPAPAPQEEPFPAAASAEQAPAAVPAPAPEPEPVAPAPAAPTPPAQTGVGTVPLPPGLG